MLDAIHTECFKDMNQKLIEREEFFNKEITGFKKEQSNLEKKLEKLEVPPEPPKPPPVVVATKKGKGKDDKKKKKTKKELEEEEAARKAKEEEEAARKAKEEEEARLKAEEEERKRKEEEEAAKKAKGGKDKKGKKVEEEAPPEEPVEETEEQKLEREKKELKDKINEVKNKIEQYLGKVTLCQQEREKLEVEKKRQKKTDLVEKASDERKFIAAGSRDYANRILGERRCYKFVEIKKNPEDDNAEEEPHLIKIDGKAIRTPDEDIKWEEEQKELEAAAPKGGKAPPKGKKK